MWQDPTGPSVLASSDFTKHLNPLFVRGKFWWGKNVVVEEPCRRNMALPPCGDLLCASGLTQRLWHCFCGHFKSLICDPPEGTQDLKSEPWLVLYSWFWTPAPAWCHTPQYQTYKPFTTLCLDHSSPHLPLSCLYPSAPWEKGGSASLRSPKDREEKAEPGAGWFEWALTLYTEGCQPQAGALLACKSSQGSHSLAQQWLPCKQDILPKSLSTGATSGSSLRISWP